MSGEGYLTQKLAAGLFMAPGSESRPGSLGPAAASGAVRRLVASASTRPHRTAGHRYSDKLYFDNNKGGQSRR